MAQDLPRAGFTLENPFVYDAVARELKAMADQGLVEIVDRWLGGESVRVPRTIATPETAARAHLQLYRDLGVLL